GDIAEILVYQTDSEASVIQQRQIGQIRAELGLDRPVAVQYVEWLGAAVRGDFGRSYMQQRPVADILRERVPRSLELALLTITLAFLWAVPLGVVSERRQCDGEQRQLERAGHALTEDVRDGALLHVRPPEVPANRRAEPLHVLHGDRPVEAELGADLSDLPLLDHARLAAGLVDEDLGDVARHEPQQHEDQDRGAEERRDEKEQPSGYVAQSVLSSSRMSAWVTG